MEKSFLEIVLFGDSMTWSPGVPIGQRYSDHLEQKLSKILGEEWIVDVAACGDGGNTAQEGFERIQRDCISYQPNIVVVSFGANDSIRAPDREQFKTYYRKIINTIRENATKHIILETIPTLDQEWHSQRNNPKAIFYGGLENYVEFFSHSFIRELAKQEKLILHDRFKIYHSEIEKDSSARERLIQKDGVHLTENGNEFFAESLSKLMAEIVPEIHHHPSNPETWLEKAKLNPVYIDCCSNLESGGLKEYLSENPALKRLMLQQTHSFLKRAFAFSSNEKQQEEIKKIECFTSALMATERFFNSEDKKVKEKNRQFLESCLEKIPEDTLAKKLFEYIFQFKI